MSTSDKICTDSCKDNDDACDVNEQLQKMSTVDNEVNGEMNDMLQKMRVGDDVISVSVCANCGKEGAKNICNKCKVTTYCNAVCKKVHKKKHKKECEEYIRVATEKHNEELRIAAELHDEKLFKQPPPKEDCPICFLRLPSLETGWRYMSCCGKVICSGCCYAPVYDNQGNKVDNNKCPFCRTPHPKTNEKMVERTAKRVEIDDPIAIYNLGVCHRDGIHGFPQDMDKALELYHRAAELGYSKAYRSIGYSYDNGIGVEVDKKKANHYNELAAMDGEVMARANLGFVEEDAGNMERALKHHMIAVRNGFSQSLNYIKQLYSDGNISKDDYITALQSYQVCLDEIKSKQRDKAAAASEMYRYY